MKTAMLHLGECLNYVPLNTASILAQGREEGGLFKDLQVLEKRRELAVEKVFSDYSQGKLEKGWLHCSCMYCTYP